MDSVKLVLFTFTVTFVIVVISAEHNHKERGHHHKEHHNKEHGHHKHQQDHKHQDDVDQQDHKHHKSYHEEDNCATYFNGCKLNQGKCICGESKGCKNMYPYENLQECEEDVRGENDPCGKHRCKHEGVCVQTKQGGSRSYKCDCTATGYFGRHCQHKCDESQAGQEDFPVECVEVF